jgi:ornithine decarboxylase
MEDVRQILADRPFQEKSFFVSDLKFVERLVDSWEAILPGIVPFFALKSNNDKFLVQTLAKKNVNFDCASKNEICQVLKAGVSPSRILFAHTIKSPSDLIFAREAGVNLATFDSTFELDKIKLYHPECGMVLRIRSDDPHALSKLEKYGALPGEIEDLLMHAKDVGITIVGISFHVGSGSRNADAYWKAMKAARDAYDTAVEIGHAPAIIDIGGGMYADVEDDGTISMCVADYVLDGIRDFFVDLPVAFIAEPGRFFSERFSTLACQIVGKRVRDGMYEYFVNDSTYGNFSNVIFEKLVPDPIIVREVSDDEDKHISTIFGCTCDGVDVIRTNVHLSELHVDDWICFEKMGAYSSVIASKFNGFGECDTYYI